MNQIKKCLLRNCIISLLCLLLVVIAGCSTPEQPADTSPVPIVQTPDAGIPSPEGQPADTSPVPIVQTPDAGIPSPEPDSAVSESYAMVIAQYADAMENDYYAADVDEAWDFFGNDVALEWRSIQQPAYYALYDFDGNGTDELLIAALENETPTFYDIFSIDNENAVRLFDLHFGSRTNFDVYADGIIEISWSSSAFEYGYDFYQVEGASAKLLTSLAITFDIYLQDDIAITEDEFNDVLAQYEASGLQSFSWISVLR